MERPWLLAPQSVRNFVMKIEEMPKRLKDYVDVESGIFQGLITGADKVFLMEREDGDQYYSKALSRLVRLEPSLMVPTLKGSVDIKRLEAYNPRLYMLFPYVTEKTGAPPRLLTIAELRENYPCTHAYFSEVETLLRARTALKTRSEREQDLENFPDHFPEKEWYYLGDDFYKFSRNQALDCINKPKLIVPSMFKEPSFFIDSNGGYSITGSGSGGGGAYAMFIKAFAPRIVRSLV